MLTTGVDLALQLGFAFRNSRIGEQPMRAVFMTMSIFLAAIPIFANPVKSESHRHPADESRVVVLPFHQQKTELRIEKLEGGYHQVTVVFGNRPQGAIWKLKIGRVYFPIGWGLWTEAGIDRQLTDLGIEVVKSTREGSPMISLDRGLLIQTDEGLILYDPNEQVGFDYLPEFKFPIKFHSLNVKSKAHQDILLSYEIAETGERFVEGTSYFKLEPMGPNSLDAKMKYSAIVHDHFSPWLAFDTNTQLPADAKKVSFYKNMALTSTVVTPSFVSLTPSVAVRSSKKRGGSVPTYQRMMWRIEEDAKGLQLSGSELITQELDRVEAHVGPEIQDLQKLLFESGIADEMRKENQTVVSSDATHLLDQKGKIKSFAVTILTKRKEAGLKTRRWIVPLNPETGVTKGHIELPPSSGADDILILPSGDAFLKTGEILKLKTKSLQCRQIYDGF